MIDLTSFAELDDHDLTAVWEAVTLEASLRSQVLHAASPLGLLTAATQAAEELGRRAGA